MKARVYQPAKTAVQQGRARTRHWVVEMEPLSRKEPDSLIGWVGSDDTLQQVRLRLPTREAAEAYCRRKGIEYDVYEPRQRVVRPKSYAANFTRQVPLTAGS
jgi:hypothetical protein